MLLSTLKVDCLYFITRPDAEEGSTVREQLSCLRKRRGALCQKEWRCIAYSY